MTVYNNFEEVAKEISKKTPPIIYKYRDWEKDFHKTIITKQELYFAQPHTLNDPYDVRPPYNFVVPDLDVEAARKRIREAGKSIRPDLTDEELEQEVEIRLQSIIQDPVNYFKKNRMDQRKIIIGIGGSATNDGGAGMARALGVRSPPRATP